MMFRIAGAHCLLAGVHRAHALRTCGFNQIEFLNATP
jgi:hypothetical protein